MRSDDIIPDIHGQSAKLEAALARIGWRRKPSGWVHPEPGRGIVFLGDFIDRGPENAAVIATVRSLLDAGKARAVMGNHELNALHFHTPHPDDGCPLRANSDKNIRQHRSFLDEFPPDAPRTRDVLNWMRTLPLFLEDAGWRGVHACWDDATIGRLRALTGDGVLSDAQLIRAGGRDEADELFDLVDRTVKGPEARLPDGFAHTDKDGTARETIRLQWWNSGAARWRDIAISVMDLSDLPDAPLPPEVRARTYPAEGKPVFFGHYWLEGAPRLQAANTLCLDYSAGLGGPLVTYAAEAGAPALTLDRVTVHD